MADLISAKLLEQENTDKIQVLAKELEIVLDSVDKGIIAVDSNGQILKYNRRASNLFKIDEKTHRKMNIRDIIGNFDFISLMNKDMDVKNIEFKYKKGKYGFRGIFDANVISLENKK